MSQVIVVKAAFDPEAGVWYTESSDVYGLRIEAPTLDALVERVPGAVQDLLEHDGQSGGLDIPIEVIAYPAFRQSQLVELLQVEPPIRARPEEVAEPQRRIGGNRAPPVQDFGDPIGWRLDAGPVRPRSCRAPPAPPQDGLRDGSRLSPCHFLP